MVHKGPYTYCDFEVESFQNLPPSGKILPLFFLTHRILWCKQNLDEGLPKRDMMIWIINSKHAKTKIISSVPPLYFSSVPIFPLSTSPISKIFFWMSSFHFPLCLLFLLSFLFFILFSFSIIFYTTSQSPLFLLICPFLSLVVTGCLAETPDAYARLDFTTAA